MEPRWPQIMQTLPGLNETLGREASAWLEMMNRRDLNLEDFLNAKVGSGGSRWGTIVVAANDSSDANKASADFVADGVNDEVALSAAVAALPLVGSFHVGRIVMLEGNFSPAGPILVPAGFIAIAIFAGQGIAGGLFTLTQLTSAGALVDASAGVMVAGFEHITMLASPAAGTPALVNVPYVSFRDASLTLLSGFLGTGVVVQARDSIIQASGDTNALVVDGQILGENSSFTGTSAGVASGASAVLLAGGAVAPNGGSFVFDLLDGSELTLDGVLVAGAVRMIYTGVIYPGYIVRIQGCTLGTAFAEPNVGDNLETHRIEIQGIDGYVFRNNHVAKFASNTDPNTYDQLHVASGPNGAPCSNGIIEHNVFQELGTEGNYRCNIRIADAGCVNTRVLFNDLPGGQTGPLCDFGTGTVSVDPAITTAVAAAVDPLATLLYLANEAAPVATATSAAVQDDTLAYMVNEDGPA